MSPDDETEYAYAILKTVMKGDYLEKIILQYNRCGSQIHLVGFHVFKNSMTIQNHFHHSFFISTIDTAYTPTSIFVFL